VAQLLWRPHVRQEKKGEIISFFHFILNWFHPFDHQHCDDSIPLE